MEEFGLLYYSQEDYEKALEYFKQAKDEFIKGDNLLVATGVKPNNDLLGLEKTKIKTNKFGYIEVDKFIFLEFVVEVGKGNRYHARAKKRG